MNAIFEPTTVEDVVDAIRQSTALTIVGGGTSPAPGRSTDADVLNTAALNRVIEHAADDMTVTVEAGVTRQQLSDVLEPAGQELAIDVFNQASTVGGGLSANRVGPRSWGDGTWRDVVLGIEAVDGRGRVFHAGGRVVKNVAGYDIAKLMIGAEGTLGVVTRTTLKVRPVRYVESFTLRSTEFEDVAVLWKELAEHQFPCRSLTVLYESEWAVDVFFEGALAKQHVASLESRFRQSGERSSTIAIERLELSSSLELVVPTSMMLGTINKLASNEYSLVAWLGGPIRVSLEAGNKEDQLHDVVAKARSAGGYARTAGESTLGLTSDNNAAADHIMASLRTAFDPDGKFRV